jgi:hypothetical protein
MNENAIDSENASQPRPDTPKPKGACKAARKAAFRAASTSMPAEASRSACSARSLGSTMWNAVSPRSKPSLMNGSKITTNLFLTPFVFNITETITDPSVPGSTLNAGPFPDFPGSSVNTDVGTSPPVTALADNLEYGWAILGPAVHSFGREHYFPDSTTFTIAGGTAPIGQSLTVPILISGSTVPEPNQSLLIALGIIFWLHGYVGSEHHVNGPGIPTDKAG